MARRQWGAITSAQLRACGAGPAVARRWIERDILHRRYHGVYSFGSGVLETKGELTAALFRAGPGAMLAGHTTLWWRGLTPSQPTTIELISPRKVRGELPLRVSYRPSVRRSFHRRLPICPVPTALLDFATQVDEFTLRRTVSEALFRRATTVHQIAAELGRGRPGSTVLRLALDQHWPGIVRTRVESEERFLAFCRRYGIPRPLVNHLVEGKEVDFVWPQSKVGVELDGPHHDRDEFARIDRRRDLALRTAGWTILRYDPDLLDETAAAELKALTRSSSANDG